MRLKDLPDRGLYVSGDSACAGCMAANIAINIMRILGKNTIGSVPPSCMSVFGSIFPKLNWNIPYFHMQFSNTASTLTGISRALKVQGKDDGIVVMGLAGDGGTGDIGLQDLSAAAQRDEDILYICYNNQAYENTGIQASGQTPYASWSNTTPIINGYIGNPNFPKDIPRILMAHDATYVSTVSTAYIHDFINKIEKAKNMKGFRYIEALSVCTSGWKIPSQIGPKLVKEAVKTGYWILMEYEKGKLTLNKTPEFTGLKEFLLKQGRFRHITDEEIEVIAKHIKRRWNIYKSIEQANHFDE